MTAKHVVQGAVKMPKKLTEKERMRQLMVFGNNMVNIALLGSVVSIWLTKWSPSLKLFLTCIAIGTLGWLLDSYAKEKYMKNG